MNQPGRKQKDEFRAAVTMTVMWVAGLTLVIIFVALFAGILLDKFLNSKPLFTVILTIASIPLTIFSTFRVVKAASSRIQPAAKKETSEEEPHRGENN
ncbi:MAG: AtpZ/AtpI family protein [Anaerolineales bacterium]|jgi:F0F1-type ATP synthase assembly protein I